MSLTCYLIDDEPAALTILRAYIEQTPGLRLVGETSNPLTGLAFIENQTSPDLTFLDIDLPELSGLSLAGLIQLKTTIIFTTGFREYAAEAFDNDAIDFLLKPITYERFLRAVQKAKKILPVQPGSLTFTAEQATLFVKTGIKGQVRRVPIPDIIYAKAASNYLEIFLQEERIVTYLTLDQLLGKLPQHQFSRIHKSHLVNHQFIQIMEYAQIRLINKTVLAIGRTYREKFREKMNDLIPVKWDQPD